MGGPDFACICAPGYSGKFCHKRNPCATNPCKNGGICKEDATNSKGFSCECKPHEPWTGELCDVDRCVSVGCKNGGSCIWNGSDGFICKCGPGYQGKDCGVDMNECDSWPCWNGVCVDLVNGYKCICDPGYTGVNCDQGP
ncbi:fibropellin-3-like [Lingula anatina]|uniref:Fibropellin-3-like n=1 Tax=Lingula anatina TaxID=7574 RepID=A0A1S3H9S6_LINAN|nr:fibropellin-3-like [Lingula anatina]|eukprot:XP_013382758.1 fibropellin-3-like [Lingula anatina]